MGDVSEFMKTLKQRFTMWYNLEHERFGTLWAERFKSVLIEDEGFTLSTVAAYIDLNPVRAKLVDDPKDYRWCGYAEALGEGGAKIRAGLSSVVPSRDWTAVLENYRTILFGKGSTPKPGDTTAGCIPPEQARQVLAGGGKLPTATVLRCRVRYFSEGVALGSEGFVAGLMRTWQGGVAPSRNTARPVGGSEAWGQLTALRKPRRRMFG
jgi:hypothetical protein